MSAYNLLAVRTGDEQPNPALYPEPGDAPDSIELDAYDGQSPIRFETTDLHVRQLVPGNSKRLAHIKDIKAHVIVTEARIAVACSKYDKGGGFQAFSPAGLPLSVGLNAVSKARASRRRKGKMLVGHIRYPRLLSVGFRDRSGLAYPARLRVATIDPTSQSFRALLLDINLPKQQSGQQLAETIARLSSTFNLTHAKDLDEPLRTHLEQLQTPPPLTPVAKEFVNYVFVHTENPVTAQGLRTA